MKTGKGIAIETDYPGEGEPLEPDWITYNGTRYYRGVGAEFSLSDLVEVARRAYTAGFGIISDPNTCSIAGGIVDKYVQEKR